MHGQRNIKLNTCVCVVKWPKEDITQFCASFIKCRIFLSKICHFNERLFVFLLVVDMLKYSQQQKYALGESVTVSSSNTAQSSLL